MTLHPLIRRLLDGELGLGDLPPQLRAQGERALRLLDGVDRRPVTLSPQVERRVMDAVRQRAAAPRAVRLRIHPWLLGPALAAIAATIVLLGRARAPAPHPSIAATDSALVQFVFSAPEARAVTVAGSFNDWSLTADPLTRVDGVWMITLSLPPGQHQYAFVVDGRRWMADPAAPAVDDGLGHHNSLVAVGPGASIL